ncbi:hypothetical protein [Salinivibrio socompensis]|nr:hypothetical protein [Salinivibrio socompensis]
MTNPCKTAASPDVTPKPVMQRFSVAPLSDWIGWFDFQIVTLI